MKLTALPRLAALALLISVATPAHAFLGLFKKAQKRVPSASELANQEAQASAELQQARASNDKGALKNIVERYPFTKAAAEAAFDYAMLLRQNGKLQDAFEAFQKFITDYRSSPRFMDAIQQQYELAEEAKGDKAAATTAYQAVVDNYPSSKEAAEAQFRIGAIANIAAKRTQDGENLNETRDALTTYMATNPTGERANEAKSLLSQVDENEAGRSLDIGKFYERNGRFKAAAIYYNEALKFGSAEASQEARDRLAALSAKYPEAVAETKGNPGNDFTRPAAVDLRSRDDYAGPPSPELAKLAEKPKMRTDGFSPIPMQEPDLPVRGGPADNPPTGSLLPPVSGADKQMLLPVPPPPPAPGAPPAPSEPSAPAAGTPAPPPPPPPPAPSGN